MLRKNDKIKILEAYFEKAISKNEMELLWKHGIILPPFSWVYDDIKQDTEEEERRALICRVFGLTDTKINWV